MGRIKECDCLEGVGIEDKVVKYCSRLIPFMSKGDCDYKGNKVLVETGNIKLEYTKCYLVRFRCEKE